MTGRRFLALALTGAALAGAVAFASGDARMLDDWPQWRGPNRAGVSAETGLLRTWPTGGPKQIWTASGLGAGFSSVAVTGGRVYTMGDRRDGQYVIALDAESGREVWSARVGGRHQDEYAGPRGTPTVDGGQVFAVTTDGDIVCLQALSGREQWRRSFERDFDGRMMSSWMFSESPLVDGDRVIVTPGGARAMMVALDRTTGRDVWRAVLPRLGGNGPDGAGYASAVISNGGGVKHYVQLVGRGLIGIRAADGAFLWGYTRVANNVANISTPVVSGDYVFASTGYQTGAALLQLGPDGRGGVVARERYFLDANVLQNHHGGFVLIDGVLYGGNGHNNGFPFALELSTGRMRWERTRGAGTGSAAVTAADGHLYFRYQDGTMALIPANPSAYSVASTFAIPNVRNPSWSHPVIAGGRLYLREQDALYVYAISR